MSIFDEQCEDKSVRQECCMSPILYNLYAEWLDNEELEGVGDFAREARVISTPNYADELMLLAKDQQTLQDTIYTLVETERNCKMKID